MATVGWNPKSSTEDSINYHSLFTEVSEGCRHMFSPTLTSTGPSQWALTLPYGPQLPAQNEEGQSPPFVQKIWEQYVDEKAEYLDELKQELGLEL